MEWKVTDAANRFGELLEEVDEHGPQRIRAGGKVYILSPERTDSPQADQGRNRLVDILVSGPDWDGVVIERIPGTLRDVDL